MKPPTKDAEMDGQVISNEVVFSNSFSFDTIIELNNISFSDTSLFFSRTCDGISIQLNKCGTF